MKLKETSKPRGAVTLFVVMTLVIHTGLLALSGVLHSPGWDEPKHVLAGVSHWEFGTFDLYRVNPPLVRMVGVTPVLFVDYQTDWAQYNAADGARSEMAIRGDFIRANGQRVFWLHTLARWGCIPFSLLGAYYCFRWAGELYGRRAGLLALALWSFSPNILAHGSLVTADVGATAMGVAAAYSFWRWLRQPTWSRAAVAGIWLGLAELTKTTWLVLFGLWPLLWIIWLVATTLKAYQLATEPTAETGLMTSRWFLVGAVEFELLLGLCLVCGVFRNAVWIVTLGCFSVFGGIALYKALSGEVSCGCPKGSIRPLCGGAISADAPRVNRFRSTTVSSRFP